MELYFMKVNSGKVIPFFSTYDTLNLVRDCEIDRPIETQLVQKIGYMLTYLDYCGHKIMIAAG
jgi:hypothetical protein